MKTLCIQNLQTNIQPYSCSKKETAPVEADYSEVITGKSSNTEMVMLVITRMYRQ